LSTGAKTNAMRSLDARGIAYEVVSFSPDVRTAEGVAAAAGFPLDEVYKTLVVVGDGHRPVLVMVPGDRELDLKALSRALGAKRLALASRGDAERLTGLQLGGISALALTDQPFDVAIDCSAQRLNRIVVSAGRRGLNLRLCVAELVRATGARWLDVAAR